MWKIGKEKRHGRRSKACWRCRDCGKAVVHELLSRLVTMGSVDVWSNIVD